MKLTGVLINYYIHCPRQSWLFYHNIQAEHTSEKVKIGKILHELKYGNLEDNFSEVEFFEEGIKLDKINFKGENLIEIEEFKKSNKQLRAQIFQVLFYLWKLKKLGILNTIGKLIFDEKHKIELKEIADLDYEIDGYKIFIKLTKNNEDKLNEIITEIKTLITSGKIPSKIKNKFGGPHKNCKGCSYFELCWV